MPAQKGRLFTIKMNTTGTTFVAVAGMREPSITINNEAVDVTTSDDSGIRKLLEGGGVTSMSVKATGVYMDDTTFNTLRAASLTNTHKKMQVSVPGTPVKTYEADFMIATVEENGTYNGSVNYSLTLESAGAITLT